jgi:hypothetical protein
VIAKHESLARHPAPHRHRVGAIESTIGLVGGPAGWFLQLCAGYGLASKPCFAEGSRLTVPGAHFEWTWAAMIAASIAGMALALIAFLLSWRMLRRTKEEAAGDHHHLLEVGSGRTRFIALWGVCFAAAFGIVTLLNFIAYVVLPRCAG